MKILILDDNDQFRQFLIASLEKVYGEIDVIECASPREAILIYESDPYFQIILSNLELKNGSFMEVFQHFQASEYNVPLISYSGEVSESPHPRLPVIPKSPEDEHQKFLARLFQLPPFSTIQADPVEEYARIRLFFLYRFHSLDFPIFIKLSDDKFVKVLNPGQKYGLDFLEKYQTKGQKYLYVKVEDFSKFTSSLFRTPLYQQDPNENSMEKQRRKTMFLQEMARSAGITPEVIGTAKESLKEIIEEAKGKKALSKLLKILESSGSYNSDHATLLCYLTSAMCDEMGWNTRRSKEKLGFASLFHDVTLIDPRLAVINYRSIRGLNRFEVDIQEKYKEHPLKASELVKEITAKYPQVDIIISQHHERPDGTGFPYGKDYNQLLPLSCVFIVAHDFVSRAYEMNFDIENVQFLLDQMVPEYRLGHFSRCILALQSVLTREQGEI
ncbi:MAG: hypothetical protein NXH75_11895 [Halobacteriovoraceae bacterium]|nr:hypothetical protein [Halobacteriovoraceae bacterium]